MKKNIVLNIVVLFCMPFTYGMEESKNNSLKDLFLSQLNRRAASFDNLFFQLHEDANEEYQAIGKQAQDQLHIPSNEHRPIKNIKDVHLFWRWNAVGLATPSAIFVDEERLNRHSFVVKKFVLLHEATHVKHYDSAKGALVLLGYGIFNGIMFFLSKGKSLHLNKDGVHIGGNALVLIGSFYQGHLRESRADQTALNELNCHKCVSEVKKIYGERDALTRAKGYFSGEQMQEIADKFKEQNKLCPEHQNQFIGRQN